MKTFKHKTLLVFAVLVGGVILSVGNGCSKSFSTGSSSDGGTSAAAGGGATTGGGGVPIIPGARTVSIVNSKQVVDQLSSCSGLASPSGTTMAMYEQKKGAISTYGSASTVTGPMMMAVTSIAGEICNDLIDQEAASGQRLFVGFNMSANAMPNNSLLSDAITRMALSCWQRNETSTERQVVLDMVSSSVGGTEAMASRKSALMICTSMLSSLDALLN